MVTHTISLTSSSSSTGQPALCPCCKASRVKIRTSVHILYEVVSHRESDELLVVDENVEESAIREPMLPAPTTSIVFS